MRDSGIKKLRVDKEGSWSKKILEFRLTPKENTGNYKVGQKHKNSILLNNNEKVKSILNISAMSKSREKSELNS